MKIVLITFLMFSVIVPSAYASKISRLDLRKLLDKSEYVVLGKVTNISAKDVRDMVTIKVASLLKGALKKNEVTFILTARGGLKDFDPQLKRGDTGVFFLIETNGEFKKAYWGSMAIFSKNNFLLNE